VKKIFELTDPKKHADRVLEGIKHDIRKYVKREKKKDLADPATTYWDFDCKIGASADDAGVVVYEELIKALDTIQATDAKQVYIEIMAKPVLKPIKLVEDKTIDNTSTEASSTEVEAGEQE